MRDGTAGDFPRGFEHFENGVAAVVADVVGGAGGAVEGLEGEDVGIGDVQDVDIVADAGAVGRGVVRAEHVEMRKYS